jgi:hypothetical protein
LLKANEDAILACPLSDPMENVSITRWFRNSSDGSISELLPGDGKKYNIDSMNSTLTVLRVGEHDVGLYECQVGKHNHTLNVSIVPVVRPFERSRNLVEGETLALECTVWGWPIPNVTWYRMESSTEESAANLTMVSNVSRLNIERVVRTDYMRYICVAVNALGSNNATILVRVKHKLAPLWPFLGILAEIVILIIIILIYEKRRSKLMADEAHKEEAEQLTNSAENTSKNEARQRK